MAIKPELKQVVTETDGTISVYVSFDLDGKQLHRTCVQGKTIEKIKEDIKAKLQAFEEKSAQKNIVVEQIRSALIEVETEIAAAKG